MMADANPNIQQVFHDRLIVVLIVKHLHFFRSLEFHFITFSDKQPVQSVTEPKQEDISLEGFNMDFSNLIGNDLSVPLSITEEEPSKKKRKSSNQINRLKLQLYIF